MACLAIPSSHIDATEQSKLGSPGAERRLKSGHPSPPDRRAEARQTSPFPPVRRVCSHKTLIPPPSPPMRVTGLLREIDLISPIPPTPVNLGIVASSF